MSIISKKREIINNLLPFIEEYGWNDLAFSELSKSEKKEIEHYQIYFEDLADSAIQFYLEEKRQEFENILKKTDLSKEKIRDKIRKSILLRFSLIEQEKEVIRKTLNYFFRPQNAKMAYGNLWKMADIIWKNAGDRSTDLNYYSKRSLLMSVYINSILFWIDDDSDNHQKTDEFVARRINEILKITGFKNILTKLSEDIKDIPFLRLLFVKNFLDVK